MTTIVGNRGQLWTSTLSTHLLSPHLDFPNSLDWHLLETSLENLPRTLLRNVLLHAVQVSDSRDGGQDQANALISDSPYNPLGVKFPGPFFSRELCRKAHIVGADLKVGQ